MYHQTFNNSSLGLIPFQIGEHNYYGTRIEVVPIRTMANGLCYKFNMTNPFPFYNMLQMVVSSSILGSDKLQKVNLFISAENTWQGTIINDWPYSKIPFAVSGVFFTNLISIVNVDLEENVWNYRDGNENIDECMSGLSTNPCASIFDPKPLKNL